MDPTQIQIFRAPHPCDLPITIAKQNGYFTEEGLNVKFVEQNSNCVKPKNIRLRQKESAFRGGDIDMHTSCHWGGIMRAWHEYEGTIIGQHQYSYSLPYAIFTRPQSDIDGPEDLANEAVAVNNEAGSHYATLSMLEEVLTEEEMQPEHVGKAVNRLQHLRSGRVPAATLMEPYITLAEHLGFRSVAEYPGTGVFLGSDQFDESTVNAFLDALDKAIEEINRDPQMYADRYIDLLKKDSKAVAQDLFAEVDFDKLIDEVEVPTYDQVTTPDRQSLERTLDWMNEYDLVDSDATVNQVTHDSF